MKVETICNDNSFIFLLMEKVQRVKRLFYETIRENFSFINGGGDIARFMPRDWWLCETLSSFDATDNTEKVLWSFDIADEGSTHNC